MVLQGDHKTFRWLLKVYHKAKKSFLVIGTFGIGKSFSVFQVNQELAKEAGRIPVVWQNLTREEKHEVYDNCTKYCVAIDQRMSENSDGSDLKGIPITDPKGLPIIEWRSTLWALLLEKPGSMGILFLDELNLAPNMVISSCYKILQNRNINEGKIQDGWLICAAGNKDTDRANTTEFVPPVLDRVGQMELLMGDEVEWINEFALSKKMLPIIIAFLAYKPNALFKVDFNDTQKYTTPRGWDDVDTILKTGAVDLNDYDQLYKAVASRISEGIAKEFVAFYKLKDKVDLDAITKDPSKIKSIKELDLRYFIVSSFAEKYQSKSVKFDKIIDLSTALNDVNEKEMVALLWKLSSMYSKTFIDDFAKGNVPKALYEEYKKYLL